jgi:hypothetical protein
LFCANDWLGSHLHLVFYLCRTQPAFWTTETMSQFEIESLAAEATLAAEKKKKRQKQRNLPPKRKAA